MQILNYGHFKDGIYLQAINGHYYYLDFNKPVKISGQKDKRYWVIRVIGTMSRNLSKVWIHLSADKDSTNLELSVRPEKIDLRTLRRLTDEQFIQGRTFKNMKDDSSK